jgi:hypothetical protein
VSAARVTVAVILLTELTTKGTFSAAVPVVAEIGVTARTPFKLFPVIITAKLPAAYMVGEMDEMVAEPVFASLSVLLA